MAASSDSFLVITCFLFLRKLAMCEFSTCDFAALSGLGCVVISLSISQFGQRGFDLRLAMTFHVHSKRVIK
jgi:hypothetical protein